MTDVRPPATGAVAEWARGFQPFLPGLQDDLYQRFADLRGHCPVARSDALGGFWVLSRYDDVRFVLQHHELFSSETNVLPSGRMTEFGPDIPTQLDPPEHTKYRRILNPALSPSAVAGLEASIRRTARRLLEPIAQRRACDFLAEVAVPLPTEVFCDLMGLPKAELPRFLEWKDTILRADRREQAAKAEAVLQELVAYFTDIFRQRTPGGPSGGGHDLMDVMISARPGGGEPTSEDEFVRMASFLWVAGLDTVTAQLAFAVLYLGRNPEQRDLLTADPARIPAAVEELVRYDTLVNDCRRVRRDVEIGGQLLRAGDVVLLLYSSAGRDPEQFPDPDAVDFDRLPNRHLGFGAGVHRCAGSHLARLQLRVALEEMHRVIPTYRVDESIPPRTHVGWIRGVDVLHLTLDPA